MKEFEDKDLLNMIRSDIKFLASFLPAANADEVEPGLAPMFYITGRYEEDVKLMRRVEEIYARYGIEAEEMIDEEEEDFADLD